MQPVLPPSTPIIHPPTDIVRRSGRLNQGQGGAIDQLQRVSTQIEHTKKRKKTAQDSIPTTELENPLAPPEQIKRKKAKKAQVCHIY